MSAWSTCAHLRAALSSVRCLVFALAFAASFAFAFSLAFAILPFGLSFRRALPFAFALAFSFAFPFALSFAPTLSPAVGVVVPGVPAAATGARAIIVRAQLASPAVVVVVTAASSSALRAVVHHLDLDLSSLPVLLVEDECLRHGGLVVEGHEGEALGLVVVVAGVGDLHDRATTLEVLRDGSLVGRPRDAMHYDLSLALRRGLGRLAPPLLVGLPDLPLLLVGAVVEVMLYQNVAGCVDTLLLFLLSPLSLFF
eukprot:CAMPEP_0204148118 /NCGR_PEP_ID=MMETSP0361-20130328/23295_1 /ASSEMBLY_ACC=CAM_ASM_000343 /TAXON_ID=268821 /ORGANISM="Scrippsiella Hangoei, Strain SHTV-5" /LENGTH=253 /DNA_ID=CAMNT_0051102417 /DNA_START=214 /DNA_END=973 /DNA_ORIENTATION=+